MAVKLSNQTLCIIALNPPILFEGNAFMPSEMALIRCGGIRRTFKLKGAEPPAVQITTGSKRIFSRVMQWG